MLSVLIPGSRTSINPYLKKYYIPINWLFLVAEHTKYLNLKMCYSLFHIRMHLVGYENSQVSFSFSSLSYSVEWVLMDLEHMLREVYSIVF